MRRRALLRNCSRTLREVKRLLHIAAAKSNLRKQTQRDAVLCVYRERLAEELLSVGIAISTHQQSAERGVGERPVFLVRDCETKRRFSFVKTRQRSECVAALKLCFGKLRTHLERLFIEPDCLFQLASCVCALSAFEEPDGIRRLIAKRFLDLRRNSPGSTQKEQREACRDSKTLVRNEVCNSDIERWQKQPFG